MAPITCFLVYLGRTLYERITNHSHDVTNDTLMMAKVLIGENICMLAYLLHAEFSQALNREH